MVITEDAEIPDQFRWGKVVHAKVSKRTLFDGEIQGLHGYGPANIELLPDGGFKIKTFEEDEFGYESKYEVIFTREDLEAIDRIKAIFL